MSAEKKTIAKTTVGMNPGVKKLLDIIATFESMERDELIVKMLIEKYPNIWKHIFALETELGELPMDPETRSRIE